MHIFLINDFIQYMGAWKHTIKLHVEFFLRINSLVVRNMSKTLFSCGAAGQRGPCPPHSWGFCITRNDTPQSVGLIWASDQRPLPDNTQHSQQTTYMPPAGFEPTIPAGERPQTYALDRAATGTGDVTVMRINIYSQQFRLVHDTGRQQHRWTISEAVNTVKCSWWWAKTSSETCRADWVQINKPKICIFLVINYELY